MISKKIEAALNHQIEIEANSSQAYLAMAIWAEGNGYNGVSKFLYQHTDEERFHMLKLIGFVNDRGGMPVIPALESPNQKFKDLREIFETLLAHEIKVTQEINKVVDICLEEKDYTTHNFMQWYVSEQIEEESLARTILDKLDLIGNDKGGLFMFDKELNDLSSAVSAKA